MCSQHKKCYNLKQLREKNSKIERLFRIERCGCCTVYMKIQITENREVRKKWASQYRI